MATAHLDSTPAAYQKLLQAGAEELALNGFRGTRIEHVALRAGCNKALVYRYFGDRDGLFRAVLEDLFSRRERARRAAPRLLAEGLDYWYRETVGEHEFLKLLQHEALNDDGEEPVEAERRHRHYQSQIAEIGRAQQHGEIARELDPSMIFLALLALITFPGLLPQVSRLVTGEQPGTDAFDDRWSEMLRALAQQLGIQEPDRRSKKRSSSRARTPRKRRS